MNKSKSDVPAKFKVIIVINSIIINALQCIFEIVRNMVLTIPLEYVPQKEAPAPTQSPLFVRPISISKTNLIINIITTQKPTLTDDNQIIAWQRKL